MLSGAFALRHVIILPVFISLRKSLDNKTNVSDERIATASTEVLADDDTHQLQLLAMRRHGVGGHHPSTLAELMSNSEFVVVELLLRVKAERYKWQPVTSGLGQNDEAKLL